MQLYVLLRGRSKKRLKPVMIDSQHKVDNYKKALEASDVKSFWYKVEEAPKGSTVWRKDSSNKWTNYDSPNPPLVKNGSRS